MSLKIRRFDMSKIKNNRALFLIGRRGTGKSFLLKDILYNLRNRVDTAYAMCPTATSLEMFGTCIPPANIYEKYDESFVKCLFNALDVLKKTGHPRSVALALDDIMYKKNVMKSETMREVMMNGRHVNMWVINCVQYLMDMGPDARTQIDYVFVLKTSSVNERQKLWKYFFGMFESFDMFNQTINKCTENFECLVLDQTEPKNSIQESVFYYKADPRLENVTFQVGRSIYWKLGELLQRNERTETSGALALPEYSKNNRQYTRVEKERERKDEESEEC